MKITLITPRMSLRPMDSEFKRLMAPPVALLAIAAITPPEHSVTVADENAGPVDFNAPADLVGITANVDTARKAYAMADRFRSRGVPVVIGGIHPSAVPEEALEHADAVCVGEAENSWRRILDDAALGRMKGIYRSGKGADLENAPPLPRRLVRDSRYLYSNVTYASRNCPFRCDFCYNSCGFAAPYRHRSIRGLVGEIRKLGVKHVMFIDDNFIGDPDWTENFLMALRPLGVKWNAAVSADIVHRPGLLDLMQDSGCQSLFIGFETINENSLKSVGKSQNRVGNYERLVSLVHGRGIMINASLAFGFDHDGPGVFRETLDWLVTNRIETMTAHILTPYPGTRLFGRMKAEGRITDFDWDHYNTSNVVFRPRNMTAEELRSGYLWIYEKFYSFENILKRIPQNGQKAAYLLFNLGYRKFGKLASALFRFGLMKQIGKIARRLAYGIE